MTVTKYNLSDGCSSVGRYSSPWPLEYEATVFTTQKRQRIPRKIWPWLMGYINTFVCNVWISLRLWNACTVINTMPHPSPVGCMRVIYTTRSIRCERNEWHDINLILCPPSRTDTWSEISQNINILRVMT